MYEMVSDGSSRAENWTDLRNISMRVFFGSKESRKKNAINFKLSLIKPDIHLIQCNIQCYNTDFNLSVGCFGIDTEMVDPKTHEMVSDRSSRAENWTDLRKKSMRVFFGSKESTKKQDVIKKNEI